MFAFSLSLSLSHSTSMSHHCSVPGCSNNAQKRKDLSFHAFPTDETLRAQWVWAIKRDEGPTFTIARGSTFVCSEHFDPGDLKKSTNPNGRTRLKQGAVPSRFSWNEYGNLHTKMLNIMLLYFYNDSHVFFI